MVEHQPDAVVMDIGLPDLSGYEVARRPREEAATRHVPLVALTGYGQLRDKEQAALAGFDAHLIKPVAPGDLAAAIEAAVRAAAQAQGLGKRCIGAVMRARVPSTGYPGT